MMGYNSNSQLTQRVESLQLNSTRREIGSIWELILVAGGGRNKGVGGEIK
jgi:hypothetical protein